MINGHEKELERIGTSFVDLPNELLLCIFSVSDVLSADDIYNVALLSRRLRALALPLFLCKHGISNPAHTASIYVIDWQPGRSHGPDVLCALNSLPDLCSIDRLRLFFQDPDRKGSRNTFQEAFHLPFAMTRVSKFVQKLKSVDTVEIYLVWDSGLVSRKTHVPVPEIKRWSNSFGSLLNLLLVRGCKSLTIKYDSAVKPGFHFKPRYGVKTALSYISNNVKKRREHALQWVFERPMHEDITTADKVDSPAFPFTAEPFNNMTSLYIHSPVLLLPPFINWTLLLLQTSPHLVKLSFANISFSKKVWTTVLPFIAVVVSTKLQDLDFQRGCPNLEPEDLLELLTHMSVLRSLSIDRSFRSRFQDLPALNKWFLYSARWPGNPTCPVLPNLQKLKAPVEFVSYLLDVRPFVKDKAYTALSQLEYLTVYPITQIIHPPNYIQSTLAINSLLDRIHFEGRSQEIIFGLDAQIEFTFTDFESVTGWIEAIRNERHFRRTVLDTLTEAEVSQLSNTSNGQEGISIQFSRITHLVLNQSELTLERTPTALCRWINVLLPNLECLTFTYQLNTHPSRDYFDMDPEKLNLLMSALKKLCPRVQTLVVGKTRHNL